MHYSEYHARAQKKREQIKNREALNFYDHIVELTLCYVGNPVNRGQ